MDARQSQKSCGQSTLTAPEAPVTGWLSVAAGCHPENESLLQSVMAAVTLAGSGANALYL
jgi:hypothetical protein